MKKILKRLIFPIIALCLTVSTLLSTAGCAKNSSGTKTLVKNVYKYDYVSLPSDIQSINAITYYDTSYYISAYIQTDTSGWVLEMVKLDQDGTETVIPITKKDENSGMNNILVASDGCLWYDETTYNYDDVTQTSKSTCTVYRASQDGSELNSFNLDAELAKSGNGYSPANYVSDFNGGIYFNVGGVIYHIGSDGNMTSADSGMNSINVIRVASSGLPYAMVYDDSANKSVFRPIDPQTLKLSAAISIPETSVNYTYSFFSGLGYDFCYNDSSSLMGFNVGDAEPTEICNWLNSDMPSSDFNSFTPVSDTEFSAVYYDYSDNYTQKLIHMTKVPDSDITEKYVINLAVYYMSTDVRKQVVEFNRTSDEYRITVTDYSKYNSDSDWNAGTTQLNNDIISGKTPDILMISDDMPYDSYVSKGLFADLGQYLDSDPDIGRGDLLSNVLALTTSNGKLSSIITNFYIRTVATKDSTVNGAQGMNMDEFNAVIAANPDATAFWDVTQDTLLEYCSSFAIGQFVDRETGKCSFDSSDFIKILEFAKTLSKESVYDTIDWNDVGNDFWTNIESAVREGRVMFEIEYLSNFDDYWSLKAGKFGGDFAFVGFPCESRNGSAIGIGQEFAISSKTKYGDACWQFVRSFLLPEYQDGIYNFPIRIDSLEKEAAKSMVLNEYQKYDGSGVVSEDIAVAETSSVSAGSTAETTDATAEAPAEECVEYHNYYWLGDQQIDIMWPKQDDIDYMMNFIKSIDQVQRTDDKIQTIIKEEASVYFAGQKSAEETAKIIQNRISTYVAESR